MTSPAKPGKFKVGISTLPNLRAKQVSKASKRNRNTKPVFSCGVFWAYPFEQLIHKMLFPFHAPEQGDGGTEWFSVLGLAVISAFLVGGFFWKTMGNEAAIGAALAILVLSRLFCILVISFLILLIRFLQELVLPLAVLAWMYFS